MAARVVPTRLPGSPRRSLTVGPAPLSGESDAGRASRARVRQAPSASQTTTISAASVLEVVPACTAVHRPRGGVASHPTGGAAPRHTAPCRQRAVWRYRCAAMAAAVTTKVTELPASRVRVEVEVPPEEVGRA